MSAIQILVVEDERLVATSLQNELGQFGYGVSGIASTANEAIEKAIAGKPDLILMDINLKGNEDGIDAARRIHDLCGIPVVYLSAFSDPATVARASQTEAFGYLLKPYEEQELRTTIEMAIAKHRVEQELEEAKRWLAAIHNGISDAVIAVDPNLHIQFMNSATETLTGWRKEDAIGAPLTQVCHLLDVNGGIALDEIARTAVRRFRAVEFPPSTWIISKDDRKTPVEGSLSDIYDSRGEFLGMVLTLRNISARLELEQLRQQEEERTRRAQKMIAVSRLAGGLSQHLNNLLTVILGNTSLALTAVPETADSRASLQQVEVAAQSADQIVQRLLLFSTLSGRPADQFKKTDLNGLILTCLKDIEPRLNSGICITYKPASEPCPVAADELLIGQALLELAFNAQDAMEHEGRLNLEIENVVIAESDLPNHSGRQAGQFVRLRVSDHGQGMKQAVLAQIFEGCFTTKKLGQAVGLGLTLVRAVVEQHHGWVECFSQAKSGTQFDLYFPRC